MRYVVTRHKTGLSLKKVRSNYRVKPGEMELPHGIAMSVPIMKTGQVIHPPPRSPLYREAIKLAPQKRDLEAELDLIEQEATAFANRVKQALNGEVSRVGKLVVNRAVIRRQFLKKLGEI